MSIEHKPNCDCELKPQKPCSCGAWQELLDEIQLRFLYGENSSYTDDELRRECLKAMGYEGDLTAKARELTENNAETQKS